MPNGDTNTSVNARDIKPSDDYLKKLNTLLPAEVTGLYLFVRSLAADNRNLDVPLAIAVLVIAVIFYFIAPQLLRISRPVTRILYSATFLLWVCSIEMSAIAVRLKTAWQFDPDIVAFVIGASVAIWTFTLPFIFDALGNTPSLDPQQAGQPPQPNPLQPQQP